MNTEKTELDSPFEALEQAVAILKLKRSIFDKLEDPAEDDAKDLMSAVNGVSDCAASLFLAIANTYGIESLDGWPIIFPQDGVMP